MKKIVLPLMLILFLAACGGGNGSSGGSLSEGAQDRSRGSQQLNSDALETTDSFSFDTRIVHDSLAEQKPLSISGDLRNISGMSYVISNLDGLKKFNHAFHDNRHASFDDLATHAYFLVFASDCPAYSELAGIDYGHDQVTLNINRFKPKENVACVAAGVTSFHVFKAKKIHAPEMLFESLEHQFDADKSGTNTVRTRSSHLDPLPDGDDENTDPKNKTFPGPNQYIDEERLEVISDASAWAALWAEHHRGYSPAPPLPDIDFTENMIVVVYLGTRSNGCYSVGIDRIYQSGETNIVEYTERTPSAEDICTMALVSPSHLVVIRKTPYPFEFRKTVRSR